MTAQRARLQLVAMCLALFACAGAWACPMCLSAFKVNMGAQEMAYAKRVVLATQDNARQFRVVKVIKGDALPSGLIRESVLRVDPDAAKSGKPLLLIRDDDWISWVSVGTIGAKHADWLRQLSATKPSATMTDRERAALVAFMLRSLESKEPMVAKIAYGEVASAPYSAMRANKAVIDANAVRGWLDDPRLSARQPLYVLLLGIAGGSQDAERLERELDQKWQSNDATNLSSVLAADLELRGPARVPWIETKYLLDPKRTQPEIHAALLALSEHGRVNGAVPRARVIESYRLFMRERKAMAALVAQDLADWNEWDAVPEYVALLEAGTASPVSRLAIVNYLQRSPRADAQAALKSLATNPR
jgi:hypothetical protein